jgi:hypothetical protein
MEALVNSAYIEDDGNLYSWGSLPLLEGRWENEKKKYHYFCPCWFGI